MVRVTPGGIAAAAALVLALGGAAGCREPTAKACPTGIFCPAGWHCAARAAQCIQGSCGNGRKDSGEVCDDGNVTDGDHCSADCTSEEKCNNYIWDVKAKEVCDPTVPEWKGKCRDDCLGTLTCGNGDVNEGEDCDPGADGIAKETATCDLDCTAWRCGDGTVNRTAGEQCDGGNKDDRHATGQSAECNVDCSTSTCGDSTTNELADEQCDDGDADHGNGNGPNKSCLDGCQRNVCGDGHVNQTIVGGRAVEECDSGPQDANYNTADCPYGQSCSVCSVCKLVPGREHRCGDGTRDEGHEQCDLGSGRNGQTICPGGQTNCETCRDGCQTPGFITAPVCGDGEKVSPEQCDAQVQFACGTCGVPQSTNACQVVSRGSAEGHIRVRSMTGLVGITLAISDHAANDATVFEYVDGTPATGTHVAIDVRGADSLNTIADRTAMAIRSNVLVNASLFGDSTVMLTNRAPGKFGNVDILVGNEPPVDSPRTAALEIGGMSGGAGCRIGEGCWDDSDCLSGDCDDSNHCAVKAPADQHESTGGDQP